MSSAGTDRAQRGHNQNTIGPCVLTSTPDFLLTRLLFGVALSRSAPNLSLCVPSSSLFALFVNSVCVAVLRVLYSALLDRLSVISEAAVYSALHSAFPVLSYLFSTVCPMLSLGSRRFVLFFCLSKCQQMALHAQIMETYHHAVRSLQNLSHKNLTPPTISFLLTVCYKARK